MSLTSILSKEKNRHNLKNWFKHNFPNPSLKIKQEIIVPTLNTHSSYAGETGTAFDYLFRFYLERISYLKNKKIFKNAWVSELALSDIMCKLEYQDRYKDKLIYIGYNFDRLINREYLIKYLRDEFNLAKSNYLTFKKTGLLTKDLIRSSLFLAKLDITLRAGFIDSKLDIIEAEKINDIEKLISCVPWEKFNPNKYSVLNPTFGIGSTLVGAADADIIIDDTLIDIKTSKNLRLDRKDLNQVLGYYLLSLIGKVDCNRKVNIKRVGIYFARFGYLWECNLSDLFPKKEFVRLANEFTQLVKDSDLNLTPAENKISNTGKTNVNYRRKGRKQISLDPIDFSL